MDPLLGLGIIGYEWAPRTMPQTERKYEVKKQEAQEALKAYERPEEWESDSYCSSESSFSMSSFYSSEPESDCSSVREMDSGSDDVDDTANGVGEATGIEGGGG